MIHVKKYLQLTDNTIKKTIGRLEVFFMKIFNNANIPQIMKSYNKSIKPTEKTGEVSSSKDKLELSEKAKEFQLAMRAFKNLPEVRQEKVDELNKIVKEKKSQVNTLKRKTHRELWLDDLKNLKKFI